MYLSAFWSPILYADILCTASVPFGLFFYTCNMRIQSGSLWYSLIVILLWEICGCYRKIATSCPLHFLPAQFFNPRRCWHPALITADYVVIGLLLTAVMSAVHAVRALTLQAVSCSTFERRHDLSDSQGEEPLALWLVHWLRRASLFYEPYSCNKSGMDIEASLRE